jgi:diguanylate cyclase (GGDEF)-like protein
MVEYSEIKGSLINQASMDASEMMQVAEKMLLLARQLRKAVSDLDRRMLTLSAHTDYVRRIIALIRRMKREFSESQLKKFEKTKKELNKYILRLRKEVLSTYSNISIQKSNDGVMIRLEREIGTETERFRQMDITEFKFMESEYSHFYGVAKEKLAKMIAEEREALRKEAMTKQAVVELVNLVSQLDSFMERLESLVKKEEELLSKVYLEEGKSVDLQSMDMIEKQLSAVIREINILFREEKVSVHDPFLKLVNQEEAWIEDATSRILDLKKPSFFRRLLGQKTKITYDDIRRSLNQFTEIKEYHTFSASLKNTLRIHPEMFDSLSAEKVDNLFSISLKRIGSLGRFAYKDGLTGLHNKRYFQDRLHELIKRKKNFSILLVDIDHFKKFNDSFGHLVGDKVLVEVAEILISSTRTTDIVCRWGGEELAILMPRTGLEEAFRVAERVRANVAGHRMLDLDGNYTRELTISSGLVYMSDEALVSSRRLTGVIAESLVSQVDALLYKAKEGGRNRVEKEEFNTANI